MTGTTIFNSATAWTRRRLLKGAVYPLMAGALAVLPAMQPAAAADELTIGMSHAHTGWAATFDVAFTEGFGFAVDEINAAGGIDGTIPIRLIQGRDTASSAAEAVKSVDALLAEDVDVLIMSADSSSTIAAGLAGQKKGILMLASTGSQPSIAGQVGDWMYLSNFGDNLMGAALAIYAREDLGIETAFLLKSSDDVYTEMLPEYFAQTFTKRGGTIVGEAEYTFEQVNFGNVIAQIRALPEAPDAIMTGAFEPDFPAFLRQLRAAGITARVLGADAIDTPTIFSLGPVSDGTVVLTNRVPVEGSAYKQIEARFAKVHPEHLDNAAWIVGYTAVQVLAEATRRAGSTETGALRAAIEAMEGFEGPSGPISYAGRNRVPLWPVHVLEVENGTGAFKKTIVLDAADIPAP